jgi:hypothetical protein
VNQRLLSALALGAPCSMTSGQIQIHAPTPSESETAARRGAPEVHRHQAGAVKTAVSYIREARSKAESDSKSSSGE